MRGITNGPDAWTGIVEAIETARRSPSVRPEIALDDTPAPVRLAAHGIALAGEVMDADEQELGHGRFVLLHEPGGQPEWQGDTRVVVYVKAALEPDLAVDPFLLEVGWDWLNESLANRDCVAQALSGTVSRSGSQPFGDLAARDPEGAIEVRASWTITSAEAASALLAWCDLLATAAGLVPLQDGVRALRVRP